jgi:hypothetical protein
VSRREQNGAREEGEKPSALGTFGAMLGLGVVLAWASIYAIPWLEGLGLAPRLAQNVPFAALACGAAWGYAVRVSARAREALSLIAMPIVTGCVMWVVGLLLGALLLVFGAETIADYAPAGGFWLGLLIGCVLAVRIGFEGVRRMLSKDEK